MKCPLGKTSNEKSELDKILGKTSNEKNELDKIPEHFVQAILVRLAKTQQFVESSLKYEKSTTFLFPQFWEGGKGLLVPLRRGVVVFVKHGLLRVSFFCGNAMQSNRVKKVKNSCMVCIYHLN
jgi:hypothetical protein